MIDYVYFGQHPDVPPYVAEPWHESEASSARVGAWMGEVLVAEDLPDLRADRDEAAAARASRPDLGTVTDEELVARARSFVPLIRRLFERHLEVTAATAIGTGVLGAVAAALGDDQLPLTLVSGVGDVDSAVPTHDLWALSRQVRASAELTAAFDGPRDGLAARVGRSPDRRPTPSGPPSRRSSGSRGAAGPTSGTSARTPGRREPALALALIERHAAGRRLGRARGPQRRQRGGAGGGHGPGRGGPRRRSGRAGPVPGRPPLGPPVPGRSGAHEDHHHPRHPRGAHGRPRAGARHGYPPSATCMLLADELDAFVNEPDELAPRLAAREQQYLTLFDLDPPFIVDGTVPPLDAWPRRTTAAAAGAVAVAVGDGPHRGAGLPRAGHRPGPRRARTRPIRPAWSRATSSWRPSPIPRGRRCSCPPPPSWSTSARRSATP